MLKNIINYIINITLRYVKPFTNNTIKITLGYLNTFNEYNLFISTNKLQFCQFKGSFFSIYSLFLPLCPKLDRSVSITTRML